MLYDRVVADFYDDMFLRTRTPCLPRSGDLYVFVLSFPALITVRRASVRGKGPSFVLKTRELA